MTTFETINKAITKLAQDTTISKIYVRGPYIKGKEVGDCAIDIVAQSEIPVEILLFAADLEEELGIQVIFMRTEILEEMLLSDNKKHSQIANTIKSEMKLVYEKK